jgi:hypothetical protein
VDSHVLDLIGKEDDVAKAWRSVRTALNAKNMKETIDQKMPDME